MNIENLQDSNPGKGPSPTSLLVFPKLFGQHDGRARGSSRVVKFLGAFLTVTLLANPASQAQTAPSITLQPTGQTNSTGAEIVFNIVVSGAGPFAYQWLFNGTNIPNNLIITVAGSGSGGFSGDGGAATDAKLSYPQGIGFDSMGDLFIADTSNRRIRMVDTNGIITTVAGTGQSGYGGDGSPAISTSLAGPKAVAVDGTGDIFIADTDNNPNNRILEVDTSGMITTVAGGGTGAVGGPATSVALNNPSSVVLDPAGDFFIADSGGNRILKVDTNGIITRVAGVGGTGGSYSGDGGSAVLAHLNNPTGVTLNPAGGFFIADTSNSRIRKVSTNTVAVITTVAGNGTSGYSGDNGKATNAMLLFPQSVAIDSARNLYIADSGNNAIRKVSTNGVITIVAGVPGVRGYNGDGGPATDALLFTPAGLAFDASGNLYIADMINCRIRELAIAGLPSLTLSNISYFASGEYQVIVGSPYGAVTSAVARLEVLAPPVIVAQPADASPAAGAAAVFNVEAAGAPPLSYSWYFNGTILLATATNSTLALTNVSPNQAGGYTVVVTNVFGSVTSVVANLVVGSTPAIADQPIAQSVVPGDNAVFQVTPSGVGPFQYQWQFNGTNIPNNLITTVAGETGDLMDDGGPALLANIRNPTAVAVDASGNLYIADYYNNRIRWVDTNGVIWPVAGNGTRGYSGDGGQATNAALNYPSAIAFDAAGNLFIGDAGNNRVRKVDTNGVITTVAGTGVAGYSGDGGAATSAKFDFSNGPWTSLAVDPFGNLFINDDNNGRVRKVGTNGIVTTVVGNGTINGVAGLASDMEGNLFIADYGNGLVEELGTNGVITIVAGNGSPYGFGGGYGNGGYATNTAISGPVGIVVDSLGNIYFSETSGAYVRRVDAISGVITTYPAGNLNHPCGIAFDAAGDLFVADMANNRIREITASGVKTTVAGNGEAEFYNDGGLATAAGLFMPSGVAVDSSGDVLVCDSLNNRVRLVDGNGIINTVVGSGQASAGDGFFGFIAFGGFSGDGGSAIQAQLNVPSRVILDTGEDLYISDKGNNRVRKVDMNDIITTVAGVAPGAVRSSGDGGPAIYAPLSGPEGLAIDAAADLYIADQNRIRRVDANGIITTVAGGNSQGFSGDAGAATNAGLNMASDVALDRAGNLFIADSGNDAIRKVATNGVITTFAGVGKTAGFAGDGAAATKAHLNDPQGVAIDGVGNLYIADSGNNRIRRVATNGVITTVAGNGIAGGSGDGGAATAASLSFPGALTFDSAGNLFITDNYNNRVREIFLAGLPTLSLNNVAATNAGNYQAILTSPYGSVTSVVARLTINSGTNQTGSIVMSAPVVAGDGLVLGFTLSPPLSSSFILLQASSLAGRWATNTAAILATNAPPGVYQFSVPAPQSIQFYQIRSP